MAEADNERFRKIVEGLDHAEDPIAFFDPDGTFIYCNTAWKDLHQLDIVQDYTGLSDSLIKKPDLRPVIDELKSSMQPGSKFQAVRKVKVGDGEKIFQIRVNHVVHGNSQVVLVMFRDVTELENARMDLREYRDRLEEIVAARTAELEEANRLLVEREKEREKADISLRESRERAKTLFQAVPVPTYTFIRRGGTFILDDCNEAAVKMTRGNATGNIGKSVEEIFDGGDRIFDDLERCYSTGEIVALERKFHERVSGEDWDISVKYVFVPPDTVMVHTEDITARLEAERELKSHRDNLQDLVESRTSELEEANRRLMDEIIEREKTQRALVESEQKYRTISEMTSDYTFVATLLPDGTLRREWIAGAFEKITGYTMKELDERLSEFSVVHPEDKSALFRIIAGFREMKPIGSIEFRMIAKSGEEVWVEAYAKPLPFSEQGYPRGMIAVKDINKRKAAEVELARRNRDLAAVNRIREIFDGGAEGVEMMSAVLDALMENSEALASGACSVEDEDGRLEIKASRNVSERFLAEFGKSPLFSKTAAGVIERDEVTVLQEESGPGGERAGLMREQGIYRTVAFPVNVRGRAAAVFLIGYGRAHLIGPEKIRFFDIVKNQIELQLEKRELISDRDKYERKLKDLTGSLIGSLERERNNMALKLHDELGQALVAINAEILFLEKDIQSCDNEPGETLAKIKSQLKDLTQGVRKMSYALHPAVLEDLGLRPALRSYIEKIIESEGISADLVTTGFDGKLTGQAALVMYRVAQEALANVLKHSGADKVEVRLIRGYPDLIMIIEDNGCGFSPDGEEYRGKGLGLITMRERVEGLNGTFKISSAPGRGTRVRVSIPMEERDDG